MQEGGGKGSPPKEGGFSPPKEGGSSPAKEGDDPMRAAVLDSLHEASIELHISELGDWMGLEKFMFGDY